MLGGGSPRRTQGTRPAQPLALDDIVATAMRLVDERGPDGFSIRLIARELSVYPTAIYWHVGDRRQLGSLMGAAWMRDVMPPATGQSWVRWLEEMSFAYRAAAHRHPNLARLIGRTLIDEPSAFELPEAIVVQLDRSGLPREEIVHAYNAMVGATVGFVDLELARASAASDEDRRRAEEAIRRLDPGAYPALARYLDVLADRAFSLRWSSGAEAPLDDSFAYLVALLTEGLARRAEGRSVAPAGA
jgi:AcrR family transcriptional regulator